MLSFALCKKLLPLSVLAVMPIIPDLMREASMIHPSTEAFSLSSSETFKMQPIVAVNEPVEMMEPSISPSFSFAVIETSNKTFAPPLEAVIVRPSAQAFNLTNETTITLATVAVNETLETKEPSMVSFEYDVDFESIFKTFANRLEPAFGLAADFFDATRATFELVREKFNALFADLSADDLFDAIHTNFDNVLFDHHESIHFSSAPMVTGNLTGCAINLGRIDNNNNHNNNDMIEVIIPTTGCTIPVFSLNYVLEQQVTEQDLKSSKKQDKYASSFMLEFLMASSRRSISLATGVDDTISVEFYFWYQKLEAFVSVYCEQVYETLEDSFTRYFFFAVPPTPASPRSVPSITIVELLHVIVLEYQRTFKVGSVTTKARDETWTSKYLFDIVKDVLWAPFVPNRCYLQYCLDEQKQKRDSL